MRFGYNVLSLMYLKQKNMEREKVIKLIRDIASGNDPYKTADAGYAEFRRNYYGRLIKAIDEGDIDALCVLDVACKTESVDALTEYLNWIESWLKF